MPIVADEYTHVIGVDTHARTHTYAIVETITGRLATVAEFPTNPAGLARAITWINRHAPGQPLVAIEGTGSFGAGLAAVLENQGVPVVEARPPRAATRAGRGKTDAFDAEAAARAVISTDTAKLGWPRAGKIRSALRVLLTARRAIDTRRTCDRNGLTALLRTIDLGLDARKPLTDRQVSLIAAWRHHPTDEVEQAVAREEATRLARNVIHATIQLDANHRALGRHVAELAPGLLAFRGIGPVTAAVFLTAYSHPGRVRSEAAFASLAGTAPLPASSGNTTRHRLNNRGDRRLNSALDVVARVRMAHDADTRAYVERRRSEGRTPKEIKRTLKRYISRQVYRQLTATMASQT